jgi:hypothetical protein
MRAMTMQATAKCAGLTDFQPWKKFLRKMSTEASRMAESDAKRANRSEVIRARRGGERRERRSTPALSDKIFAP